MELNPALGINLKDHDPNDILNGKLWRITEKVDGVRRLFYKDRNGHVSSYSRTGKADQWLGHITSYLEASNFPKDLVYDTELVDSELYIANVDSFLLRAETTGKAGLQYSGYQKTDLVAICFDIFSPDGDLRKGAERHHLLNKIFSKVPLYSPIFLVPYYGVLNGNDSKTLNSLMKTIIARDGEGLMLNNLDAPYIHGRSKELVKVKRFEDFIGEVIDIEYGANGTKIEGGIASLICTVSGCTVPIRVGTGFSKEERLYFAKFSPIGAIIEIEAFGKTKNKHGDISLSMPVFKRIK